MEISYRLNKIANKVTKENLADIGTDHAYIPIFLYKNNKIKNAIACDISKGSLQKAKDNIKKYGLDNKIKTRLSDGLEKITLEDKIETIVIAGMGGMLILNILKKGNIIANNSKELILQPQKDIDKVRKYLIENSFKIIDDEILKDDNKYYTIIKAIKGNEPTPYTKVEYIFGRFEINNKCQILKEYIKEELYKMEIVLKNIKSSNAKARILELESNIELYKEVFKCL